MTHPVILVVDDEPDSADILGMLLGVHYPDAIICVAYGGQAALEQARQQRPDAAILDLEMPGLNGEKLAFAIRASFPDSAPLLIALSGNVMRLGEILGNGAFDYQFSKPADVEGLLRVVTNNLYRQK